MIERIEAQLVDGSLMHPAVIGELVKAVTTDMLETVLFREAWRDIIDAHTHGYFTDSTDLLGGGYIALGEYLADRDRWAGQVYNYGFVNGERVRTDDPVTAAEVILERHRRRHFAAELAQAADAVAKGADPDVIRTYLAGLT